MATTTIGRNTFLQRVIGAMALDTAIYEEVENDRTATAQAFTMVVISSLAAGVGARGFGENSAGLIAYVSIVSLLAWAAWALVTFEVGARILPGRQTRADVGQLLRTIGFASAPGVLRVLGVLPGVTVPVFALTSVWMLIAMIVAVRQALDYQSATRAVAVCLLGWLLSLVFVAVIGMLFGPTLQ